MLALDELAELGVEYRVVVVEGGLPVTVTVLYAVTEESVMITVVVEVL